VAEGSIISASSVERSVIGIRSRIGLDSIISDAYIMGSDYYETLADISKGVEKGMPAMGVGQRCQIHRAIIDKNCRIGNDVIIRGGDHLENKDHPLYTVKDGIVVVKKGAVIPDGFVI
jgi:glucose-1-phosphate adenylyltransferase